MNNLLLPYSLEVLPFYNVLSISDSKQVRLPESSFGQFKRKSLMKKVPEQSNNHKGYHKERRIDRSTQNHRRKVKKKFSRVNNEYIESHL